MNAASGKPFRGRLSAQSRHQRLGLVGGDESLRELVQHAIALLPGSWILQTYSNAAQAISSITNSPPKIVLLEAGRPDISGVECAARLKALLPSLPLIMLSAQSNEELIISAFLAGVDLYLIKPVTAEELASVLVSAASGSDHALAPNVTRALIRCPQRAATRKFAEPLTPREHQVMGLLLSNQSEKDVAQRLGMATATVHAHKAHLFRKLAAHNSAEAVRKFLGR